LQPQWIARPDYDLPPVTDRFAAGPRPILVVGASGLLGAYIHRSFGEVAGAGTVVGTGFEHVDEGLVPLDIRDEGRVHALLDEHRPRAVVCAAAVSNVERCESDPGGSRAINVEGTLALSRGAAALGATFVFLSSEYVFDGLAGPYSEDAPMRPLNEYGRQKQEVERLVPAIAGGDHLIARVSCLYGHERIGKNFVYQLWAALSEGREFHPPSDQIGTPTAVSDAADVIRDLLLSGHRGTFHVAGPQPMLRSEFARLAARELELDPALVRPRPTGELGLVAPRPMDAGLSTGRVRAACRALCAPREGIVQMLAERPIGAPLMYAPP
jgi:dTDP-4-dehydrorhamnose reductase